MFSKQQYFGILGVALKDDIAMSYNKNKGHFIISCNSSFYDYKIEIKYLTQRPGLSPLNPFEWLAVKSLKDETLNYDSTIMKYVTHLVEISFLGTMKYPEKFNEDYYREVEYIRNLDQALRDNWDTPEFFKNYPHYIKLYEINKRLQNIEKSINTNNH